MIFLLLLLSLNPVGTAPSPNPVLTPGIVRTMSLADVCKGHNLRNVTSAMKTAVFKEYGVPTTDRKFYVIDHLIALELGGANGTLHDLRNLWPQRIADAHRKDLVENSLHRAVCAIGSTLTLHVAQEQMRLWGR